ncbi:MAG: alanine racemase [Lachnospirales bacterium]
MYEYHRLLAEINLDAIGNNIREIRKLIKEKTQLLAVVKADAYGHGAEEVAKVCLYNGADQLAVATCNEGVQVRQWSIQVPVLILGNTVEGQLETVINNNLTQAVFRYETAKKMSDMAVKLNKTALIHIKIDTGMSRIGFLPNDEALDEIEKIFALPNLKVTGVFTHFATADEKDKTFTMVQYKRFRFITDALNAKGHTDFIRHCANSGAILDMPELQLDMVRAGIIIYGMYPSTQVTHPINLIPAMSLKSQISYVKYLEENVSVGYGRTYFTTQRTKVATIPIGYADGYSRAFSNKARVIINGHYAPIIGNVCMDQMMVDVTNIPDVKDGDSVIIMGSDGKNTVSAEELANIAGTINYEIVCDVGKRVPRVYVKNGEVIKESVVK